MLESVYDEFKREFLSVSRSRTNCYFTSRTKGQLVVACYRFLNSYSGHQRKG